MLRYANPAQFMRLSGLLLPWVSAATVVALAIGLFLTFRVPPDYQQGMTVLILFLHIPAVTMAMGVYGLIATCSLVSLVWRHPLSDVAARTAAPLGALFTVLGIVCGSLWGRPMWGTYWVWDARLTSMLLLLFLYLGHIALSRAYDDAERGDRAAAILALVGAINLPVIKFSVDWWNTLHQPASVMKLGGPSIHPAILTPLMVMAVALLLLFVVLVMVRTETEIDRRRLEAAERAR